MKVYKVTKRNLVSNIMALAYEMAPAHKPRNIDKINEYVINWANEHIGKEYLIRVNKEDIRKFFKDLLFQCVEFTQLNISQAKWDKGIRNYNDQNNSGIGVTIAEHDINGNPVFIMTPEDYYDFIDLDAFIQNLICRFSILEENDEDCFLCKYAKSYKSMEPSDCEECNTCFLNPNHKCNYETHPKALIPRNQQKDE